MTATAQFPTKVWDGATPARSAEGNQQVISPGPADFDQLREEIQGIQVLLAQLKLANIAFGFKVYTGDGVDSSGGSDVDATFTGAVVGERVVAMFGQTKADAGTTAHTYTILTPGTHVQPLIGTTDKIAFKSGVTNKAAFTFVAICAPALVTIAAQ